MKLNTPQRQQGNTATLTERIAFYESLKRKQLTEKGRTIRLQVLRWSFIKRLAICTELSLVRPCLNRCSDLWGGDNFVSSHL